MWHFCFQLFKCKDLMPLMCLSQIIINWIFGFWAVGQTQQHIWRRHIGLLENISAKFSLFSDIIEKIINVNTWCFLLHCIYLTALVTSYFSDEYITQASGFQPFWLLRGFRVAFQMSQIVIFPSKLLTWFHFNKCSNDPIFHQKSKITEKVQKLKTDLCIWTLFFLFSSLISRPLRFSWWPFGGAWPLGWEPLDFTS